MEPTVAELLTHLQKFYASDKWLSNPANLSKNRIRLEPSGFYVRDAGKGKQLVIPDHEPLRTAIIREPHDPPYAGHRSAKTTEHLVQRLYWWPGMQGDIAKVVADFAAAARRAVNAGFQVLEIHAAHGYLIHQFLSPLSNERTDDFGGPLKNRARLLLDIVRAVRAEVGEEPVLFVRFSATDWVEGGWNEEETSIVTDWVKDLGVDTVDISTGGLVASAKIPVGPGFQVPLAHYVKEHAHLPTAAVGLITEAQQANDIIESGRADAVLIGREMLRDPHFPLRAAAELGAQIDYAPEQYGRAPFAS